MISWTVRIAPLFIFIPAHSSAHRPKAIPLDPFLVVQPSLNDSLLVKQGLVEETTLPQPTHSAYDIQVRFAIWLVSASRHNAWFW
jgi:hypothetical protein